MGNALFEQLSKQRIICADGGFATHLEDALGVTALGSSPVWSASLLSDSPDLVLQTHLDFLEAGAQIIGTASYQASLEGFQSCGIDRHRAIELMRLSITLADEARTKYVASRGAEPFKPMIALSLGPYGAVLRGGAEYTGDYGDTSPEDLIDFHLSRLRIFAEAPATWAHIDLVAFETVPRLVEARAIVEVLRRLGEEQGIDRKPAYVSFVFPEGEALPRHVEAGTSLDGKEGLKALIDLLPTKSTIGHEHWTLSGLGINCTKVRFLPRLVTELSRRLSERIAMDGPVEAALFLEPDGGMIYDGATRTWSSSDGTSSDVGSWQQELLEVLPAPAGPESVGPWTGLVLGGCCKASTAHIAALRRVIDSRQC